MKPNLPFSAPQTRSVFGAIVVRPLSSAQVPATHRPVAVRRGALVGGAGR